MLKSAVKGIRSERIIRLDFRMSETVNVPLDLAGVSPYHFVHGRNDVLEPLPFFRAAVGDYSDNPIERTELFPRMETRGVDTMGDRRDVLAQPAPKLSGKP